MRKIAVLVVFVPNDFGSQLQATSLLREARQTLDSMPLRGGLAWSGGPDAMIFARGLGAPVLEGAGMNSLQDCLDDPKAFASLKHRLASLSLDQGSELAAIVDVRSPYLRSDGLAELARSLERTGGRVLISLDQSRDHPIQVDAYYEVLDGGDIVFLDQDAVCREYFQILMGREPASMRQALGNGAFEVSHMHHLCWEAFQSVPGREAPVYLLATMLHKRASKPRLVEKRELANPLSTAFQSHGVFFREGPSVARRAWPSPVPRTAAGEVEGLPFFGEPGALDAVCLRGPSGPELYLRPESLEDAACCLIWPTLRGQLIPEASQAFPVDPLAMGILVLDGQEFAGPVCRPRPVAEAHGFYYALLGHMRDNVADVVIPLEFEEKLWAVRQKDRARVLYQGDADAETEVTGRQFFPDTYEFVSDFVLAGLNDLENVHDLVAGCKAHGFAVDQGRLLSAGGDNT